MSPQVYRRRHGDRIPIVDTGRQSAPNGYLLPSDLAVCRDCVGDVSTLPDGKPEVSWEPMGHLWGEVDSPTHCSLCEALIVEDLTPEGLSYVREQVDEPGRFARPNVFAAWREAFLGEPRPTPESRIANVAARVIFREQGDVTPERAQIVGNLIAEALS